MCKPDIVCGIGDSSSNPVNPTFLKGTLVIVLKD